ncbi:MAG: hypothetical protein AAB221_06490, partial [Bacteroidota bacterium]
MFSGAGESGSANLAVETTATFPPCSRATPTTTSTSWSVANDCWGTEQKSCKDGLDGCSLDCNFGSGYTAPQYAANDWLIPKGKWNVNAEMKNINSYAKCHGIFCIGDDCSAKIVDVYLALGLDNVPVKSQSSSSGAWAKGDGAQEATKAMGQMQFGTTVECAKAGGCNLNIRRYFTPQGMAHRMFWPGGSGDYHYQHVTADVSVTLQKVECASNDLADGTSTECINIYGSLKPVCDTATNTCIMKCHYENLVVLPGYSYAETCVSPSGNLADACSGSTERTALCDYTA